MSNTIDTKLSKLSHKEDGPIRNDLSSTQLSLNKIEESLSLLADILIKLNDSTIRTDLELDSTVKITETHLYQWSKL